MAVQILADSCCDFIPELLRETGAQIIPLTVISPDGEEMIDDASLDLGRLLESMRSNKTDPARSACPSVEAYAEKMAAHDECVVITLSKNLSGSYNAARLAMETVLEQHPEKKIYIIDSKSASAGETLIALYVHGMNRQGASFEEIVEGAEELIRLMDTVFLLKDLSNLVKNGRVSKLKGKLTQVLQLFPVLSDDGNGEIVSRHIVRGYKQAKKKLVSTISEIAASRPLYDGTLVLCHCFAADVAEELKAALLQQCEAIKNVVIVPMAGLSTIYANDGGVVLAF
jgi:DegV family protein with EDD domain